jgi:hypothetical protein
MQVVGVAVIEILKVMLPISWFRFHGSSLRGVAWHKRVANLDFLCANSLFLINDNDAKGLLSFKIMKRFTEF